MHKQIYRLALLASFGACQAALAAGPDVSDLTKAKGLPQPQPPDEAVNRLRNDVINAITHGTKSPVAVQEFGTALLPFSTARADAAGVATNTGYPYSAVGKLFVQLSPDPKWYDCSASLIKPGIVVTAAHCAMVYGGATMTAMQFLPAYRDGAEPYGRWSVSHIFVPSSWANGTDSCLGKNPASVCANDVAVLVLQGIAKDGITTYAGDDTGYLNYALTSSILTSNCPPTTPCSTTHVTELGYPDDLDSGNFMERNDTQGAVVSDQMAANLVFGSLMYSGSSGGPIIINFGLPSVITGNLSHGQAATPNSVVGVVSWGLNKTEWQGSSQFTENNVTSLVTQACNQYPEACSTMTINEAEYGVPGQFNDLTAFFKDRCDGKGYCAIAINNENLGGDPAPGKTKAARYEYTCSNTGQHAGNTWEGQTATSSCR